jgi:hypothetical protein
MAGRKYANATFDDRVRVLVDHPEIWRAWPAGDIRPADFQNHVGIRALWLEVVRFLQARGLASNQTMPIDINVPKLMARVRELAAERGAPPSESGT